MGHAQMMVQNYLEPSLPSLNLLCFALALNLSNLCNLWVPSLALFILSKSMDISSCCPPGH